MEIVTGRAPEITFLASISREFFACEPLHRARVWCDVSLEMAKKDTATQGEFVGEGGWSGLQLVGVALVTILIVLALLWIASPNVNPH